MTFPMMERLEAVVTNLQAMKAIAIDLEDEVIEELTIDLFTRIWDDAYELITSYTDCAGGPNCLDIVERIVRADKGE